MRWLRYALRSVEAVERMLARLLVRLGRPVRIQAFHGFGTGSSVLLGGRVLVGATPPRTAAVSRWAVFRANLQPFLTVAVPGAQVRVALPGRGDAHEVLVRTDRQGYLVARFDGVALAPGRHPVMLTPVRPAGEPTSGAVHMTDPSADLVVVSDVDDTIVDTGIAHGVAATLATTLLQQQSLREALPGVAELYRALARGPQGVQRPFFYLSTSPWNLVEFLQQFLARHGFPDGPLILTDWGPGADGVLRVRTRTHKLSALRDLALALPGSRFVLIGDSGQQDASIYAEFAAEHPGRVAAVYIRRAGAADATGELRVDQGRALLTEAGVPFVVADDATAMLEHAVHSGLATAA